MTKTREDLVTRALSKLGAIGAGQTPSAEDAAVVDGVVEPVMDDLASRGIYSWGDPDELDDDAFEHLAQVLSVAVARDFGLPSDEMARLAAESRLRQLNPTVLSGQPQTTEYY